MKTATILRALGSIDAITVRRDAMLRWMVALPLVIALAMRLLLPQLVQSLDGWLPLDLRALFTPLMGYMFLLLVPFLWGVLSGFLLLDQRDDRTLVALQVTPLSTSHYLIYRLSGPLTLSVISTFILFPLTNLADLPAGTRLFLALGAAPMAPLAALLLVAVAQNKVQGLAMMKASGLLLMPPLVAYFLPSPWHWLASPVPTFWPAQMFWQAVEDGNLFWFYLIAGSGYQLFLTVLMARRFERIMHR